MSIKRHFMELLGAQHARKYFVCVGLDSDLAKIPESARRGDVEETLVNFTTSIVNATLHFAGCFKPNAAFYEGQGDDGWRALKRIVHYIHRVAPALPVILDAKRGDIDNTNNGYIQMAFDWLGVDAITVPPYLGGKSLQPFLDRPEKGIIVLCKTSNPDAGEFQDRPIKIDEGELDFLRAKGFNPDCFPYAAGLRHCCAELYKVVALRVARDWNKNGNCAVVVGATYPEELANVRKIIGDMPALIPGIGKQQEGVSLEEQIRKVIEVGLNNKGEGVIINSSREILFASKGPDFAEAAGRKAKELHDAITSCLTVRQPQGAV